MPKNYQMVSPAARAELSGILAWARKHPHPFSACMNSKRLRKRVPNPESRKKICATMKDTALNTTSWRKGG